MTLPHFQDWGAYAFDTSDTYRRLDLLAKVRRDCFDTMVRRATDKAWRDEGKHKPREFKVGDLVICWLNSTEIGKLLERFGGTKFAPMWSEPCRVVRLIGPDDRVLIVKSVWHKNLLKKVNASDVLLIPKMLTQEMVDVAKYDLVADLKRAAAPKESTRSAGRAFGQNSCC